MKQEQWFGGQYLGDGRSRLGVGGYLAYDRATGSTLPGQFVDATSEELARAGELATQAYFELAKASPSEIANLLELAASGLQDARAPVVARATSETGLGEDRLQGELDRTAHQLRMFAGLVEDGTWRDARIESRDPERHTPDLRRMRVGLGPVAVFGASNFPLAFSVAGGDTASALAAGCPVIAKAHPSHPGTCELVADILVRAVDLAGLPKAAFQMLHGRERRVGRTLVQDPNVRAVAFTGSFTGGMALRDAVGERDQPIPVFAEMGSLNPVFVFPEAVERRGAAIAEALANSVILGVGQFCTKPGLVLGRASDAFDRWCEQLADRLAEAAAAPMLNERIASGYLAGLKARADAPGIEVLGRPIQDTEVEGAPAAFRVSGERFLASKDLQDELFGPATLIVRCADDREVAEAARVLPGTLTITLHAEPEDFGSVRGIWTHLVDRTGRVVFNGVPTGVAVSPAMNHGGPFPATTDARFTSVGTAAIERFSRPVCYQDVPTDLLPRALGGTGNLSW